MLNGNGNDCGPYSVAVTLVILFIPLRVSFTLAVCWFNPLLDLHRISCSEFLHVRFSPKNLQISSLTALQKHALLLVCFSYCKCGVHLQRPLFLNHTTGSCIHCAVTPVNPGFKLGARGEIWVDVWWMQPLCFCLAAKCDLFWHVWVGWREEDL